MPDRLKPVLTVSNQNKQVQTGFDWLNPVLT
ncbi:hypothetical protein CPC197_1413, partial [Chlamydia psittaci C1/97]